MTPADFKGFTPAGLDALRRILEQVLRSRGGRK